MMDLKNNIKLNEIKNVLFKSKKYWIIYLLFISLTSFSLISMENIYHPKFELMTFVLVAVLGVLCIIYYFLHDSDKELHKVAFVIIISFGLICSLMVPIVNHIDELEHFTRSEITSEGVLMPDWIGDEVGIDRLYNHTDGEMSHERNSGVGFNTIGSMKFYEDAREETVFETNHDEDKINDSAYMRGSAFEQNPFYGYLPQAIGILLAKLLDLNVIWMLWLGRIFNLIFYAIIISIAIKKTPFLKMPLIVISCIPLTIYHASSVSIDSMIFGLGILTVSYFLYLYNFNQNSIENKEILIFTFICLILGLCKLPYLAFIFLLIFVPRKNFKNKNVLVTLILSIIAVGILGLLWSKYSTPTLMHSWRSSHNYINSTQQLSYLANNYSEFLNFLQHTIKDGLYSIVNELFNYNYRNPDSFTSFRFVTLALQIFLAISIFAYPYTIKFNFLTKLGSFFVFFLVYMGTFFIQLLTWANVGNMYVDVHMRYFIPIIALIPIFIQLNKNTENKKFDRYIIVFVIGFMATLVLSLATTYY